MPNHRRTTTLLTLPIEILHDIFDYLDGVIILTSLGGVCIKLNAATRSYTRYRFDFRSISMSKFNLVCRLIQPSSVVSLTLWDTLLTPGQIGSFLSLFHTADFTRLVSLSLNCITYPDLRIFLHHFEPHSLTNLSVSIDGRNMYGTNEEGVQRLLLMIPELRLTKLTSHICSDSIDRLRLLPNTLRYLSLPDCTYKLFCKILRSSPSLKTFVIHDNFELERHEAFSAYTDGLFKQLISLIILIMPRSPEVLESVLSLTPSLVHITIGVGKDCRREMWRDWLNLNEIVTWEVDALKWERLIRTKLLSLQKFQFCDRMSVFQSINNRRTEVESLTASFRTPSWLEEKCWFVACDLIERRLPRSTETQIQIMTYTLPFLREITDEDQNYHVVTTLNNSSNDHVDALNYVSHLQYYFF